ncbi:MAG: rod shape-determining protein MreC, partial [Succinivibrionaceae bacterium]|nr:rod shape-determining protein MreC [Succinivibrionaceae bacterium]
MRNQNLPGLSPSLKLLIAIACSLSLIVSDSRSHWSTELRVYTDTIFSPLYLIANTPFELNSAFREQIRTRSQLVEDNRHLNETLMLLKSELLKYGQLKHENAKLRALLESPIQLDSRVEVAEIMNVATDPFQQQVVMNKGTENGVYIGQPIIGEDGIVGQVVTVSNKMSRALLITDRNHSIPVRVVRNDFRAIATGTGKIDELVL